MSGRRGMSRRPVVRGELAMTMRVEVEDPEGATSAAAPDLVLRHAVRDPGLRQLHHADELPRWPPAPGVTVEQPPDGRPRCTYPVRPCRRIRVERLSQRGAVGEVAARAGPHPPRSRDRRGRARRGRLGKRAGQGSAGTRRRRGGGGCRARGRSRRAAGRRTPAPAHGKQRRADRGRAGPRRGRGWGGWASVSNLPRTRRRGRARRSRRRAGHRDADRDTHRSTPGTTSP